MLTITDQIRNLVEAQIFGWHQSKTPNVAAGEYATESEVFRDGLRTLAARDKAVETWLRNEVVPAAAALDADPGRARSSVQLRTQLAARRASRKTATP